MMKLLMMIAIVILIILLIVILIFQYQIVMQNIIMEIVSMNDNVIIPKIASKESAGLDLCSSIDVDIEVGSIKKSKYWDLYISSRKFLRIYKR